MPQTYLQDCEWCFPRKTSTLQTITVTSYLHFAKHSSPQGLWFPQSHFTFSFCCYHSYFSADTSHLHSHTWRSELLLQQSLTWRSVCLFKRLISVSIVSLRHNAFAVKTTGFILNRARGVKQLNRRCNAASVQYQFHPNWYRCCRW